MSRAGIGVRRILFGAGLLCLTLPSLAAEPSAALAPAGPGTIAGQVTGQVTLQPIAGAVVAVDGMALAADTDSEGRFRIADVPAGSHRLLIVKEGFLPRREADLVVTPGRETTVALRLQEMPVHSEQVEVTASYFAKPEDAATSTFGMNYEEVRRAPGALGDVSRSLQSLPAAMGRDDNRNDIVARGGSPTENLILVDNIEVPNLSHFGAQGGTGGAISMLNTELVGDVTFSAGGFPARHGNRLSSVLEVALREGNRKRFGAEFDLGFAGAGLVAEGPIGTRGSWIASARRSYLNLIAGPFNLSDIPTYSNYTAKAVYDLSPRHQLSLLSLGGYDTIEITPELSDTDDPNTMVVGDVGWRTVTGLNWRTLLGQGGVGTLTVSHALSAFRFDLQDLQLDRQTVGRNRSREGESTAKYDLAFQSGPWSGRAGASGKWLTAGIEVSQPLGVENPFSTDPTRINVFAVDETYSSWQGGGHVQLGRRVKGTTLTVGGRYDYYGQRETSRLAPRATLSIPLGNHLDLTGSAGRYSQMPPLVFREGVPENAALDPIEADHYVAGLAWLPQADLRVTVEAYHKRYQSYPVSTQATSLTLADFGADFGSPLLPMVSQGRGRSSGLELFVQKKLSRRFWGQAAYAFSQTEHQALDGQWRTGIFDAPHVASLLAGYRLGFGVEVSTKFAYTSGRPQTPFLLEASVAQNRMVYDTARVNAERAPAYHRLDLRMDKRQSHRWGNLVWYLEVDNLYNRPNVLAYVWNPKTRERQPLEQLGFLTIGGVNIEF